MEEESFTTPRDDNGGMKKSPARRHHQLCQYLLLVSILLNLGLIVYVIVIHHLSVGVGGVQITPCPNISVADVSALEDGVYEKQQRYTKVPSSSLLPVCTDTDIKDKLRSTNRTAAHLYLDFANIRGNVLPWTTSLKGRAFMSNVYYTSQGHLKVVTGGLYFIYAHVTVNSVAEDKRFMFYQTLVRQRTAGTDSLMIGKTSVTNDSVVRTTYIAGNFLLQPKDELFIQVSEESAVLRSYPETFFGLHKIGG